MRDEDKTKKQLINELVETRQKIGRLKACENECKQAQERIEHLNLVLHAIRNVNQLITKEKDRDKLLKGACDNLIENLGYYNAWIIVLDESHGFVTGAEAGLGDAFLSVVQLMKRGKLTNCGQKTLSQSDVVIIQDPLSSCTDCPLSHMYSGRGAMTVQVEYGGKIYGLLSASLPSCLATDKEEQNLFKEVAGDIAFALHSIESAKELKQAEEQARSPGPA